MEKILYIAATSSDGSLAKVHLETLTAAKELAEGLSAELIVGVIGEDVSQAASAVAGCGAAKFLAVSGPEFEQARYSTDAAAAEALFKACEPTIVLAGAGSRISRFLPGAAYRVGGRVDTRLTRIEAKDGKPMATRWYYRQRMYAELTREQRPWFMTLEPGFKPAFAGDGSADFEQVTPEIGDAAKRTTVNSIEAPSADRQTIRPDAEMLFVTGAGWTKKQADGQTHVSKAEGLIVDFLDKTKSSLGSSKSLVDMGGEGQEVISILSHLHQVGQTGSTPRHPKGLATCCHGEEPHVVGWRFINERRAVNLDAGCGWAQGKADVLYVADAFELMQKVNELL